MYRRALTLLAIGLFLGLSATARAADDDAVTIVDKAIKAHFPKGLDTKNKGLRTKAKGTLHINGVDLEFTQEVAVQMPSKFKEVMQLTVMNNPVTLTSVYNGKEAWIRSANQDVKVTDEILNEFKEAAYAMNIMQGVFLKDKSVKFSLIGESKLKGKPVIGVTVSRKDYKDINLFFDKETGLIAKTEMRKRDLMTMQEVTEERIITEYQEVDGRKVAKKVEVLRDGKALLESEILELKILETVDDSEFVQPK
jgi:hypothetical protein